MALALLQAVVDVEVADLHELGVGVQLGLHVDLDVHLEILLLHTSSHIPRLERLLKQSLLLVLVDLALCKIHLSRFRPIQVLLTDDHIVVCVRLE